MLVSGLLSQTVRPFLPFLDGQFVDGCALVGGGCKAEHLGQRMEFNIDIGADFLNKKHLKTLGNQNQQLPAHFE